MATSIIDTSKAMPLSQEEIDRLPPWRRPDWTESANDVLHKRLDQLHGLASCLYVLGKGDESGDALIDDALPMLGSVMMDLTMEAIRAKDVLERESQAQRAGGLQ